MGTMKSEAMTLQVRVLGRLLSSEWGFPTPETIQNLEPWQKSNFSCFLGIK